MIEVVVKLLGGYRAAAFALLAMLALSAAGLQSWRLDVAQKALAIAATKQVKAERDAEHSARVEEQTRARYISGVDAAFERGKANAKATGDRVAADLRDGNQRLLHRWQGCEARHVPGVAADPGLADAEARDREDSTGRIIGAGAKSDQQIRCLQAVALIDRGLPVGDLSNGCPESH